MLRALFLIFIGLHGLIHLMGFLKAFELAEFRQLTQDISRVKGLWWLAAALLIVLGAVLFFGRQAWWWMPGLAGALISQVLIFQFWQDARAGTFPNIILLLVGILGIGAWNFNRMARSELATFWPDEAVRTEIVRPDQINDLPLPVQRWLNMSGVVGKPRAENIHLWQEGQMRTAPGGKWMNFNAEQWFTTRHPSFLWKAKVGRGSPVRLNGMDQLVEGKGHMLIKLFGWAAIVDARGPAIDQGSLLRYLAETIWFPSMALSDCIRWEAVNEQQARATLYQGNLSVSGVFTFNEAGEVTAFEASRYYDRKEGATLETWHIDIDANSYKSFAGVRIPTHSEVTWKLDEGDFNWLNLDIVGLERSSGGHLLSSR